MAAETPFQGKNIFPLKISNQSISLIRSDKIHTYIILENASSFTLKSIITGKIISHPDTQTLFGKNLPELADNNVLDVSEIKSPMAGLVLEILVKAEQVVEKNQLLCVLEAMKMENEIRSPMDGQIKEVFVRTGNKIDKKQTILTFC